MIRKGYILFAPITVLTITWFIAFLLYFLNPFNLEPIRGYTWFVLGTGLLLIYLGYFSAKLIGDRFSVRETYVFRESLPFYYEKIKLLVIVLTTMSLIGRIGSSYMIFLEAGGIEDYLVRPIVVRKLIVEIGQGLTGTNIWLYKLFNYLGSFTTVSIILAGAISNKKELKLISIYPLLIAAFHSITTLERTYFVKHYIIWISVSFIIIYFYPTEEQRKALISFFKRLISFIIIVSIFIVAVIFLRHVLVPGSQLDKVLNSFYFYIAGNIFWLDKYFINDPGMMHGMSLFRSFISWFVRLGLLESSAIIAPHYEFYKLYNIMGNTFTYIRFLYEDFGIIGVISFSYLLGWSGYVVMKQYLKSFSFLKLGLASMIIFAFFWTFYGFSLIHVTTMVWKLFILGLIDLFLLKKNNRRIRLF